MMIGSSIYGVAVINGSLCSRFYGMQERIYAFVHSRTEPCYSFIDRVLIAEREARQLIVHTMHSVASKLTNVLASREALLRVCTYALVILSKTLVWSISHDIVHVLFHAVSLCLCGHIIVIHYYLMQCTVALCAKFLDSVIIMP